MKTLKSLVGGGAATAERSSRSPARARRLAVMAVVAALAMPGVAGRSAGQEAPSTGPWATAAPPIRRVSSAVQLTSGKVLVAQVCGSEQTCWEMFDPVTGMWQPGGYVREGGELKTTPDRLQSLIALRNGHALVYLLQGFNKPGRKFRFNGSRWVPLPEDGSYTFVRQKWATVTLLDPPGCYPSDPVGVNRRHVDIPAHYPCGAAVFAGGKDENLGGARSVDPREVPFTADLYTYDANNPVDPGHYRELAGMPINRQTYGSGHQQGFAVVLDDGRLLVGGGKSVSLAQFFDPSSGDPFLDGSGHLRGTWSRAADIPSPVISEEGAFENSLWTERLPGGRVLVGGSRLGKELPVVFDPAGGDIDPATGKTFGSWVTIDHCPWCRHAALLPDGKVLAVAPPSEPGSISPRLAKAFVLDPSNPDPKAWSWKEAPPPVPAYTSTLLDGGGSPERCGSRCGYVLGAGGTPGAQGVGAAAFYFDFLEVKGIVPPDGPACGGRKVTISGRGLERVNAVRFGDATAGEITHNPGGSLTVATARHLPGAVPVTVSTAGGAKSNASASAIFTYAPVEPPRVTGLSTREGRADRRTPVTINGSFPAECVRKVTFGPGEATFASPGPTAIKATSPTGTPGMTVPVEVLYDPGPPTAVDSPVAGLTVPPNGGVNLFTYRALPAITGVPGISALGGPVAISGTNFEPDADDPSPPKVTFDGVTRAAAKATATRVDVTAPPMASERQPGPGAVVTVETVKRGRSDPALFNYHPGVLNISPPSGSITGGESRVITGAGLRDAEVVLIGGQEAKILDRPGDGKSLVVSTPARAEPESVPVEVVVAGLASLETVYFNYGDPAGADPPAGDPDPGPPLRQGTTPQAAPPGGTGSPAPSPSASAAPSPSPSPSPVPGGAGAGSASASSSGAPSASSSGAGSPGGSPSAASASGQAPSPAGAGAVGAGAAPAPGAAAAPAQATPGSGQAGAGGDDERGPQTMPRHNMTAANVSLGLGGAGAAMCFSGLALARRRRSARSRPRPKGAY